MSIQEAPIHLLDLGDDVLYEICLKLDPFSLIRLGCVNRKVCSGLHGAACVDGIVLGAFLAR